MFNLTVILASLAPSMEALLKDPRGGSGSIAEAADMITQQLDRIPFDSSVLGFYVTAMPEMLSVVVDKGTLESGLESAFKKALYDRLLSGAFAILGQNPGFADTLSVEIDTIVDYLSRVGQFLVRDEPRSVAEAIGSGENLISRDLIRVKQLARRIRDSEREPNDFRILARVLADLGGTLNRSRPAIGEAEAGSDLPRCKELINLCIRHAELISTGSLPLTTISLPSRFDVVGVQRHQPSAHSISKRMNEDFLGSFASTYGMEPSYFVAVRESLKTNYRLMNPAIMQVMYDHFKLSKNAWNDDFALVSRNAKSGLRVLGRVPFETVPKKTLDPLVRKTFGKAQGLHNYAHVPIFAD